MKFVKPELIEQNKGDRSKLKTRIQIPEATGASITKEVLLKEENRLSINELEGYCENMPPKECTELINKGIEVLHKAGGGTLVFPAGSYRVYTIVLLSNVNLLLEKGATLSAARTDVDLQYINQHVVQIGEGGNYLAPEVNKYLGLQDHGHSYFANSLIYAEQQENIMIYGEGTIDGSFLDEKTRVREFVLLGGDPMEPKRRSLPGYRTDTAIVDEHVKEESEKSLFSRSANDSEIDISKGSWFGNKGIAFVNCKNIVFADFSIVIGGHFAIITEGVENLYIDHILVDTNRDALDLDCCQNVTVKNSTFNSLTDDGIVVKASYGAGRYFPSRNILIEDCRVSGYDAGTVYNKTYTTEKMVADDACGPTGRVKLGTESTCGYEQVTVRRTVFDRSRGFALEAVDGSPLKDIIFEDCTMKHISSSPFYIRAGERGRFPVTGNSPEDDFPAGRGNVRLDNCNWILPNSDEYEKYPAKRFKPSYNKTKKVCIDGVNEFCIVDDKNPASVNEANLVRKDGKTYPVRYDVETGKYVPDTEHELRTKREEYYYANACGYEKLAKVSNIRIKNVKVTDADPRYPILLMGLTDSPIENVELENIEVTYRGGITMEQAVEQRQIFTDWKFSQFGTKELVQKLPWQVNPFFAKNEGLLPRVDWDDEKGVWVDDPYNVPELSDVYPEPSNWGILPAYGIYARHVKGLFVSNVKISVEEQDERHIAVLDDAENVCFDSVNANVQNGVALVTNHFRRPTNLEYIVDEPYFTTSVEEFSLEKSSVGEIHLVEVNAPAPGTPQDTLYGYPTTATPENGYSYKKEAKDYPLPKTVYPNI